MAEYPELESGVKIACPQCSRPITLESTLRITCVTCNYLFDGYGWGLSAAERAAYDAHLKAGMLPMSALIASSAENA